MSDETKPQEGKAMSPASAGSLAERVEAAIILGCAAISVSAAVVSVVTYISFLMETRK